MHSTPSSKKSLLRRFAPLLGFLAGAFVFPFALFVFCVAVLHDRGGLLIYPLAGMIAAPFGLLVGFAIRGTDDPPVDEKPPLTSTCGGKDMTTAEANGGKFEPR